MIRWIGVIAAMLALASCGVARNVAGTVGGGGSVRGPNSVTINDTRFRSKLTISGDEKREMSITVRPVSVDPEAAQEAGRYRATYYCLRQFGSSQTQWAVGPDIPVDTMQVSDDTITLQGRCTAR